MSGIFHLGRHFTVLIVLVSAAVLLTALGFQYIGGLAPCPLCHLQRYPYIATLLLGLSAFAFAGRRRAGLVLLSAVGFAIACGLGVYHAGVEYMVWAGPDTCTGTVGLDATSLEDLRAALEGAPVVRCDEIVWSLAGISMAGYNALIAGGMTLLCLAFGVALWRRR